MYPGLGRFAFLAKFFEQRRQILGVLFLLRQNVLHDATRGRIIVPKILRDEVASAFLWQHVIEDVEMLALFDLDLHGSGETRQRLRARIRHHRHR